MKLPLTPLERRATFSLASIFALRMLGLFMILPVFALYANDMDRVTPLMVGLAIGIYGLTQALLQIPFGMLSDRIGRKPVIAVGLLLFALGSVMAAMADTIEWIIAGRALQGSGAIAAAVMALMADLTQEEHRTRAMAVIGMTIGFSFLVAMVAGPLLAAYIGVDGIFWLTALFALVGIAILYWWVPNSGPPTFHRDAEVEPVRFAQVVANSQLMRLNLGVLILHMVLTAGFVALPLMLRSAGLVAKDHWMLYLPAMTMAMVAMVPFIIAAEKRRQMKQVMIIAITLLVVSQVLLGLLNQPAFWAIGVLIWLFFTAFNLLEAMLPSLVAKYAPAQNKGTAMGLFTSSQFIGAFIGGIVGGWCYGLAGAPAVFFACAALLLLWLVAALTMDTPSYLTTSLVKVGAVDSARARQLEEAIATITGVAEVAVNREDGVAYLKVDSRELDHVALEQYSVNPA